MSRHLEKVVGLAKQRVRPKVIAQRLGITVATVYADIRSARRSGVDIPHFATPSKIAAGEVPGVEPANQIATEHSIAVPTRLRNLLETEADRLGKAPSDLARDLLEKGLLEGWSRRVG